MRALLPEPADDIDVHTAYAAEWTDRGGIRANMIASADGAAAADGLTEGLQTPGDNRVFAALRDLADVVLIGWGTAKAEDYRALQPSGERLERRTSFGLGDRLPIGVITRSLAIPPDAPLLDGGDQLVITCDTSDPSKRDALAERAEVLVCGDADIDYGIVRRTLAERGLTRVLCEGGPTILSRLIDTGECDELCLTVSPIATGPGAVRIVTGDEWASPRPLRLHALLEEDGALFARYQRP